MSILLGAAAVTEMYKAVGDAADEDVDAAADGARWVCWTSARWLGKSAALGWMLGRPCWCL